MKDTEYTYAVARIRANECRLIANSELFAMVPLKLPEITRRLKEKGYALDAGADTALKARTDEMWALLSEILPDPAQFNSLLIRNDFHNLKVSLKALFTGKAANGLFLSPSVYDPEEIKRAVFARENEKLPPELRHADRSAYRILTKTGFAQLSDAVIDRAAMETAIALADAADSPFMRRFAQLFAALTDIKVLYRCVLTGKEKSFMERAVCANGELDKAEAIAAAAEGMDAFLGYLGHTQFAAEAEALKESASRFEKYADDRLLALFAPCKSEAFGIGPLVGYWFAVRTEVMNVRILLSGKTNGLPDESIRERMRALYV